KILGVLPDTADVCRDNREFLQRAVRFLVGEAGITQFLDIGSGLPSMGNVHEVAQAAAPGARVAYVDYDPVVLSHARALLANSQPAAVLLVAVLHFVTDVDRPYDAVRTLVDALAPGSYLVLTHSTPDDVAGDVTEAMKDVYSNASAQVAPAKIRGSRQVLRR